MARAGAMAVYKVVQTSDNHLLRLKNKTMPGRRMSPYIPDYESPHRTSRPTGRIGYVIVVSVVFGILWNIAAVRLMGGGLPEACRPTWLLAGVAAGVAAGLFTIWSRTRRDGRETLLYGIATYYVAIVVYWAIFVVLERINMCIQWGGWTDFDLHDHLTMVLMFFVYGTLPWGIVLIPLCLLSRELIWRAYRSGKDANNGEGSSAR